MAADELEHRRRYKAAAGREQSPYALKAENERLRASAVSMRQLLAALMMELPENVERISYRIEDLECINPEMVRVELVGPDCNVSLVVPGEPGGEPQSVA